jgi:hypothetical protein
VVALDEVMFRILGQDSSAYGEKELGKIYKEKLEEKIKSAQNNNN